MSEKNNNNPFENMGEPKTNNGKKRPFNIYYVYIFLAVALLVMAFWGWGDSAQSIDNTQLEKMIINGDVEKIVVKKNKDIAESLLNAISSIYEIKRI
ncbi:MAG: hypothetical protein J5606_00055, partial [Bacteroidales bacterium]|nr:hypothetical protein [Bacteroidales bacterium]